MFGIASEFFSKLSNIPFAKKKRAKKLLDIVKSLNKRIKDDYSGSVGDLVAECLASNKCKVEPSLIMQFQEEMIALHTDYKLEVLKQPIEHVMANRFQGETEENKAKIERLIIDSIKYSLQSSEKIDMDLVIKHLSNEMSSKDGEDITKHFKLIEDIIRALGQNELSEELNKSIVDVLKEEAEKIGKGWFRKLLKVSKMPKELSLKEYNEIENLLYWDSGYELETISGYRGEIKNRKFIKKRSSKSNENESKYLTYKGTDFEGSDYERAKAIISELRIREGESVPKVDNTRRRLRGRILDVDSCLSLAEGVSNNTINEIHPDISDKAEESGAIFVVEELNKSGNVKRVISQSWVWRNLGRVCFDNIEIPSNIFAELKEKGEFDKLLDVYKAAAIGMIAVDELALNRLVELDEITEEDAKKIKITEVTLGSGCQKILQNISGSQKRRLLPASTVLPYEASNANSSVAKNYASKKNSYKQVILVDDSNVKPAKIDKYLSVTGLGLKYTQIREVQRYVNEDINDDVISKMRDLNQAEKVQNGFLSNSNIETYVEIAESLGIEDGKTKISVSASNDVDWYIVSKEDDKSVTIEDSLVATHFDKKNPKSKFDKIMSLNEYSKELFSIIYSADNRGKRVKLDPEREGRFGIINCLVEKRILDITNQMISVQDPDMLFAVIKGLEKEAEIQKRERLIADISYVKSDER